MNRPLIIGEAPGKNGDPSKPCEGRIGARLAACAGITYEEYLTLFDRINLLDEQPQDAPKGMAFNVKQAGKIARAMEPTLEERPLVLLLGKRVAGAFGFTGAEYFQMTTLGRIAAQTPFYIVPHPSGVNRWWNELGNELQMIRFMHSIVAKTPEDIAADWKMRGF